MPQELDDARERLSHFISHYNHYRPHQGIDGLVPADRFFGAQDTVREELEAQHGENELLLALGQEPRRPLYLVGRIGERSVSMHGERGKLVINGPDGEVQALDPEHLGMPKEETIDERADSYSQCRWVFALHQNKALQACPAGTLTRSSQSHPHAR